MNKDEVLDALEDEREKLLDAIDGLTDEQMAEPGVVGDWSVKDILHHLSAWEAEMVKLLWQAGQGGRPDTRHFTQTDMDATNAAWYAIGKDRPLERVMDDFAAVRKQTIRRVSAIPEADFENPSRYPWQKNSPLWEWIGGDSFEHDGEHAADIRRWRERLGYK